MPPPSPGVRHPDRPRPNLIPLGRVADAGLALLAVSCDRCGRRGRLRVARLLAEWGRLAPVADVVDEARRDCPRWLAQDPDPYDRCRAVCPDLSALRRD